MPPARARRSGPNAYLVLRRRLRTPLVITCEHASGAVPRPLGAGGSDRDLLRTHRGLDIGAWEIARTLSAILQATAIGGRYSRLIADLNRAPGDPSLVLKQVDGIPVRFNGGLTSRVVGRRVARYHAPYHDEIDRQVARRVFAGVRPLILSIHSFTPSLAGRRRDFDIGVLYGVRRPFGERLAGLLRREGFSVAMNRPYSGRRGIIYAAARHGANYFVPYLELEINQALLSSAARARKIARQAAPAIRALLDSPLMERAPGAGYAQVWIPRDPDGKGL